MKRVLLMTVLLLLGAVATNAQWSIAPEVGLSAFNHNGVGDGWRPAVKAGAAVDYAFKQGFSVESGLYYTQRGYSLAGKVTLPTYWPFDENPSLVRHLLQIPLRAGFSWTVADDTRIFAGVGPYVGFYFANDWKQTRFLEDARAGNTFDWGISMNAGVEVKQWFFRLGYDISLGNEFDEGVSANYHVGTVSVGYRFRL